MTRRALLIVCCAASGIAAIFLAVHPAPPAREVVRGDLELRDRVLFAKGAREPFTGMLVEDYAPGRRKLAIEIRDGLADGKSRGWFENGQLEVEETFVHGVSHGVRTRWHANGQRRSEENIARGKLDGAFIEWHDNGQRALTMTFRDGTENGLAEAWSRDGAPKSRVRFDHGKIIERQFFDNPIAAQ